MQRALWEYRNEIINQRLNKITQSTPPDCRKMRRLGRTKIYCARISAFGIGSMIYSGLEFGQYFELERDTKCHNVLLALTPATRMAFIFIQMYFIFLNNEVNISRRRDECMCVRVVPLFRVGY